MKNKIEVSVTDVDAIILWLKWAGKNHPDSAARLSARLHAEELEEELENWKKSLVPRVDRSDY